VAVLGGQSHSQNRKLTGRAESKSANRTFFEIQCLLAMARVKEWRHLVCAGAE
jgi:hypothetical protein